MQQNFNSIRELTDEDLDNVAGAGVTWTDLYTYVVKGSGENPLSKDYDPNLVKHSNAYTVSVSS